MGSAAGKDVGDALGLSLDTDYAHVTLAEGRLVESGAIAAAALWP